jgi:putative oxidoreductase
MNIETENLIRRFPDALLLVGRLLMAGIFVHEGAFLLANFDGAAASMAKLGVPSIGLVATIVLQLMAGFSIALGFLTRYGAIALALFCLATAALFHTHFSVRDELLHFEKDLAIAGGLFTLAIHGGGAWSIEAMAPRWLRVYFLYQERS